MNVLIVGNGFDRKLGLKTDYISFLEWLETKNLGEPCIDMLFQAIPSFNSFSKHQVAKFLESHLNTQSNVEFREIFRLIYSTYKTRTNEHTINLKFYITLLQLAKNEVHSLQKTDFNIWYSYFKYLRKFTFNQIERSSNTLNFLFQNKVCNSGNWIEMEALLEENFRSIINNSSLLGITDLNIFSFTRNLLFYEEDYLIREYKDYKKIINQVLLKHFNDFKLLLVEYLKEENSFFEKRINALFASDFKEVFSADAIINFNYTNTVEKILSLIEYNPRVVPLYYVHGNLNDKDNIVFGLDSYFRDLPALNRDGKSEVEAKLLNDEDYVKYSKLYQLLNLQKDKKRFPIGTVNKLKILGHSIGEQDYSYFYSIFDRNIENIEIEYLYYTFNDGINNNKLSGQDSLFRLINSYENYTGKRVFHKMIFEGRIKFSNTHIPQLAT